MLNEAKGVVFLRVLTELPFLLPLAGFCCLYAGIIIISSLFFFLFALRGGEWNIRVWRGKFELFGKGEVRADREVEYNC